MMASKREPLAIEELIAKKKQMEEAEAKVCRSFNSSQNLYQTAELCRALYQNDDSKVKFIQAIVLNFSSSDGNRK